ncbi:MAG TPA: translation initiation factor IF-2 [Candidatus Paceibacterota bacterium]|nr:translation initiation factor IF-2 [Candidatus Paceibacterota bacterium]
MAQEARPPVIAVMGHIDHGKSSLLDYIRRENTVAGEAGGITQHVAAYIALHNERSMTFLDTPGHEAFRTLRTRGAAAADIAILVVAADEGVMPQTLDALSAIKEASIPFIVAITKIDKNNADIEHTKMSLIEQGVFIEGMGGDVGYALVSSKTGEGIPELLDLVLLASDIEGLSADPAQKATGFVLESTQDQKRGSSVTLIIKDGTLTKEGFIVAGDAYAPIRFIEDFQGQRVEEAGPSSPVRISGFNKLPAAGSFFTTVKNKKEAESAALENAKISVIAKHIDVADGTVSLPLIVKGDTAGSIEAIVHELAKITHEHVTVRIITSGVGTVSENDVKKAHASHATLLAFCVGTDAIARELAERDHVTILSFSIIYELAEHVLKLLEASAPASVAEKELGRAKVLKAFSSSAKKQVLGARYISGILTLGNRIKLMRGDAEIARGSITNLQQSRIDAKDIRVEGDFGIEIETREPALYGDEIIAFSIPLS